MKKRFFIGLAVSLVIATCYGVYGTTEAGNNTATQISASKENQKQEIVGYNDSLSLDDVGTYTGIPYVVINSNVPFFTEGEKAHIDSFESYSGLDALGRCGVAFANISKEIMPTEERGEIGSVKPSGWHTENYHEYIDGNYLYNRCHLIGYQLSGENANEKNLITGTRYLNVEGMLPFENEVAYYVENTNNHVLYRVTPIFEGDNLVASGVLMEAYSVEDQGQGLMFNVYCYNVQPGIIIDYATGNSELSSDATPIQKQEVTVEASDVNGEVSDYVLNTNTRKFHYPSCKSVNDIKEKNKQLYHGTREDLINQGYDSCGNCKP